MPKQCPVFFSPRGKGDSAQEPLLAQEAPSTSICLDDAQKEMLVKTVVTAVFIFPFVLSSVDISKRYPIAGTVFSVIGNAFIARLAWVFYARHFIELFDENAELAHIRQHLVLANREIVPIQSWSMQCKALVLLATLVSTLPLGLTKIGLDDQFDPLWTTLKIAYLTAYAVVDATPHINHLQLQSQAVSKFFEFSCVTKAWIIVLMAGHALSDSADIWNAKGFWFYWVCAALFVEFYLSNVEAVAHQKPHLPEVNVMSIFKLTVLFLGAVSMALFNWHNTFQDSEVSIHDTSKIIFILLQIVNVKFVTFEAWHHEEEASEHHHSEESHHCSVHGGCGLNHTVMYAVVCSPSVAGPSNRRSAPRANNNA